MTESAYEILGIERNASQQNIDKAWRRAAQRLHPDKNPGDAHAHERFIRAREAYNQLSGHTTQHSSPSLRELMERYNAATKLHNDYQRKKHALKQLFRKAVHDYRDTHTLVQHLVTRWFPFCQRHQAAILLHSLRRPGMMLQDTQTALHITHVGIQIMILKNTPAETRDQVNGRWTGLLNTHIKRLKKHNEAIDNALGVIAGREPAVKFTL